MKRRHGTLDAAPDIAYLPQPGLLNTLVKDYPGKVLPEGSRCGDVMALAPEARAAFAQAGAWD